MSRIPLISSKDQLALEHHTTFDAIAASRGSVRGPFAALMNVPALASVVANVGTYVRFESSLPNAVRELATIAAATELQCTYEVAAHKAIAKQQGIPDAQVALVELGAPADELPKEIAIAIAYARELVSANRVSKQTFNATLTEFGLVGITELTTTIGYYGMIAAVLNAFEIES